MPRGAKRDLRATLTLRQNRFFLERGSFISQPDKEGKVHLYLDGVDKTIQRERVWAKSKQKCVTCARALTFDTFEWDHIVGGLVGRCDCLHNAAVKCGDCHREKHPHVRLGESRTQAIEDFNKVNPPEDH